MFYEDPNTNPEQGVNPESGAAPEQNAQATSGEYHYTRDNNPGAAQGQYQPNNGGYQPNYRSQPGYTPNFQQTANPNPPRPPKKKKKSGGAGKVVALALVCSLVGGLAGAGGMHALYTAARSGSGTAAVSISDRSTGDVELTTSTEKAGEAMTPAQIYKTYGSAVVCVNVTTKSGEGAGTGFIIDGKEGYLLTCYHVIDGAQAISVVLTDSTSYEATYVGGDKEQDVAILKIVPAEGEKLNLNSVVLGDSSLLAVGDTVSAIGNALGTLANTLTSGSVSALDRAISMSDGTVMNLMQTDTTINSGNSGGPLFNQYGEVIGIVNAKYSSSAYTTGTAAIEGIGFAIPINDVTAIMEDLMKNGYVTGKPYLGISVSTVSAVAAQHYQDMVVGAYVQSITSGSCAEKAGLQQGDIITQADDKKITTSAELIDIKNAHKAGDEMVLTVYRNKDYVTLKVTLDEEKPTQSPIDDGTSNQQDSQGNSDFGYGFNFGNGNGSSGNGSSGSSGGFGFGWPFGYGW